MDGWLSLDSIPDRINVCLSLPNSELWQADFLGAFLELTRAENWEEHGALSALEMSDEWRAIFFDFVNGACSMIPVGTILEYGGDTPPTGFLLCDGATFLRADFADLFAVIGEKYGPGNGTTTANLPNRAGRAGVGLDSSIPDFDAIGNVGGLKDVTLTVAELAIHSHIQDAHTHLQDYHNHEQGAHGHTQNSHNHTQDAHTHPYNYQSAGVNGSVAHKLVSVTQGATNLTATVATNQAATAVNQGTVATNVAFQATNDNETATNQNSGSGEAHDNMPPYLVSNYIIKY